MSARIRLRTLFGGQTSPTISGISFGFHAAIPAATAAAVACGLESTSSSGSWSLLRDRVVSAAGAIGLAGDWGVGRTLTEIEVRGFLAYGAISKLGL